MIYVSIGATIAKEIKTLIDYINPINFKYEDSEITKEDDNIILKDYQLGRTSPHPRPEKKNNHGAQICMIK